MTATIVTAHAVAERIGAAFEPLNERIDRWRDALQAFLGTDGHARATSVDPLVASMAIPAVSDADTLIVGAGFVASPGYLADAPWHLAWWLSPTTTDGAPRRLATASDPNAEAFRDYTALEWWRVPTRTGRRHLTGPYIDFLCTDDYTVTITTPVTVSATIVGVMGADLGVARLERRLLPVMAAAPYPLTLVNESGRTVISTDTHRPTGSLLRLDGLTEQHASADSTAAEQVLADGTRVVPCGSTSLRLVIHP